MQGLTVQSLNEHSAVNDNSSLVLKVRIQCISKLNNEEIIIKDFLGAFETGHKRSVKHIYRRLCGKKNNRCEKSKICMARILKPALEFGWQAAKFLKASHHINLSCVRNMH